MQNRVQPHPAGASSSASSGGDGSGSGFCLSDIMEIDAGSGGDHKAPGSPRSKHSATEQRRRCKINERFQILRDLVPQSDQKRDKATFLLEVIEYVKFLQEKVQKHEACAGGDWSQENTKLMPWVIHISLASPIPYRSVPAICYAMPVQIYAAKNIKKKKLVPWIIHISLASPIHYSSNRVPGDLMPGVAPTTKNCSAGNFLDNSIPTMPEMLQNAETVLEPANSNADITESKYQSEWQQLTCPADCLVDSEMSNEKEDLTIDEGTITVSSVYSQNLFTSLTNAMENLGIDLSQASVTVHVNLGRRAVSRRSNNISSAKGAHVILDA
ncbi:transcription factor BIM2-like isoform X2 [Hordeum vulgare subsp. vulgare]|uniref:transcription factor BIM2-like isoform X2 n=1 Tax=Hordeum vulgare subsp. vulgare TaxID=112509 RepID=UPI001D1A5468|nr:transcription factor BIM2-like isoform X2 [Hordeum vulgare subsp. vulgare]